MLNKEFPFLRILLPLCFGIVAGLYFKPARYFLVGCFVISITGFCISLFFNKYLTNIVYGISLTVALFLSGLLLYSKEKKSLSDLEPKEEEYLCTLSEYPEEKPNSFGLVVKLDSRLTANGNIPLHGSLLIYLRKDQSLASFLPGDLLKIRCTPARIVNRGNPEEFDYRFYMENHGIKYFSFTDAGSITGRYVPKHRKLKHTALIGREKIISMYRERGITGDTLALVAAITLGQKNMLDQEQKQYFIKAGIMHIMAVSGLHAVILSIFIFKLLFFLRGRLDILRSVITVLFLWMFAFVTGLTPSVLRATLMFSLLQGGNLLKRNVNPLNSVLASAFVLILSRPSVIFDAGFLLSYSAVIFIIRFYHDVYSKVEFRYWLSDKIWQSAVVTIVAQAGTLPLTIMLFNRFPTWFIFTNIIIVPLSSLLIIIGCLVPLTFPVEFISRLLAYFLGKLTGLTELLTEKAAGLPVSTIDNIGMLPLEAIMFFVFIFLFMWYLVNRRSVMLYFPLSALLVLIFMFTIKDLSNRFSNELIVYNTRSVSVGLKTGNILNLYTDTAFVSPDVRRHSAARGLKIVGNLIVNDLTIIKAGDKKILITSSLKNSLLAGSEPDFIISTGKFEKSGIKSRLPWQVRYLIFTNNVSPSNRFEDKLVIGLADSLFYCKKSGAFRLKI